MRAMPPIGVHGLSFHLISLLFPLFFSFFLLFSFFRSLIRLQVGAKIVDLCEFGDKAIVDECAKQYSKKKGMAKGIAFPTCISVNNIVGHFTPAEKDDKTTLKVMAVAQCADSTVSVLTHVFLIRRAMCASWTLLCTLTVM